MNAPVARRVASGRRTLATNAPDLVEENPEQDKKKGKLNRRCWGSVARTLAIGTSLWCAFGAAPVQASDRRAASSVVEAGIGTLPLLAAMGLGIIVSVAAVIAFLQMTAKSRGAHEEPEETDEDDDGELTVPDGTKPRSYPSEDESEGPRST